MSAFNKILDEFRALPGHSDGAKRSLDFQIRYIMMHLFPDVRI
jgi:hypothetical protein